MKSQTDSSCWNFTLIELLVVISIISLLISILLPALGSARKASRMAACMTQIKQIQFAASMYAAEYKDVLPGWSKNNPTLGNWDHSMARFLSVEPDLSTQAGRNIAVYKCPESLDESGLPNQNPTWWGNRMQSTYTISYLSSCSKDSVAYNSNDDHYAKYQWLKESQLASPSEFVLFADSLPGGTIGPNGTTWGYPWYFDKLKLSATGLSLATSKARMLAFRHMSTNVFAGEDMNAKLNASFLDGHVKPMDLELFADTNATEKNYLALGYKPSNF